MGSMWKKKITRLERATQTGESGPRGKCKTTKDYPLLPGVGGQENGIQQAWASGGRRFRFKRCQGTPKKKEVGSFHRGEKDVFLIRTEDREGVKKGEGGSRAYQGW